MSPENRARVARALDQVILAARRSRGHSEDVQLAIEYALRIVESVERDEAARRAERREGA
jgi:hypothetical protein